MTGGPISCGLYAYNLCAYGPSSRPRRPSQTLIGAPGANWDYRLQNVHVTPAWPVAPTPVPVDARPKIAPQVPAYLTIAHALFQTGFLDIDSLVEIVL